MTVPLRLMDDPYLQNTLPTAKRVPGLDSVARRRSSPRKGVEIEVWIFAVLPTDDEKVNRRTGSRGRGSRSAKGLVATWYTFYSVQFGIARVPSSAPGAPRRSFLARVLLMPGCS